MENFDRTLFLYWMFNRPRNFQSLTLNKILTELCLLTVLPNIIQQHLTKRTAYLSDYVKPLPELSCLESRLVSELQGAPGSRDHQASPSSLCGYQNTTESEPATTGGIGNSSFLYNCWMEKGDTKPDWPGTHHIGKKLTRLSRNSPDRQETHQIGKKLTNLLLRNSAFHLLVMIDYMQWYYDKGEFLYVSKNSLMSFFSASVKTTSQILQGFTTLALPWWLCHGSILFTLVALLAQCFAYAMLCLRNALLATYFLPCLGITVLVCIIFLLYYGAP